MKRSIAVISSLLLITHALAMPINAIASQTVDVKEEMLEDSNLPLDNGVKENESSKEEASGGKEEPSTEEKKDDVEEDVITEDDTEEDESSNEEEDITTEDGSLKDESNNIDNDYIYKVLPLKMQYNLHYIKLFTVLYDIKIIFRTVGAVLGLEENNSQQSDS